MQYTEILKYIEPAIKLLILVVAVSWWLLSSRSKAKKLAKELEIAKNDILFLLAVETEYGEEMKFFEGSSYKNIMRSRAKSLGYQWSGKFTKGSIEPVTTSAKAVDAKQTLIEKLLK